MSILQSTLDVTYRSLLFSNSASLSRVRAIPRAALALDGCWREVNRGRAV